MEVKIVSTETVKPSSPTPSHLRNMKLSFLDQKSGPITVPTLLFYRAALQQDTVQLDIANLKTCLSETLTRFYPLAGRYQTWGTNDCNDEGIPFIEAHVNCPISTLLTSFHSSDDVDFLSFYPPHQDMEYSGVHLAIQVNVFTCGGFAIGWCHTHKVTDGASAAGFLRYWAALVTRRYKDAFLDEPDFNAGLVAFPHVPEADRPVKPDEKSVRSNNTFFQKGNLVRSFVINSDSVTKLKAKSVSDKVTNPTRFEAVAGFIWEQILSGSTSKEGRSMLSVVVDLRSKTLPPLAKGSMGNLLESAFVQVEKGAQLTELVAEIHGSISDIKDLVPEYQGENRLEAKEKHWQSFIKTFIENKGQDVYIMTAWCKSAGFRDVDFGFGKPVRVVPVVNISKASNSLRNTIILMEYKDSEGDGFEAWLFLEEQRMKYLESNPQFLAFATPKF